jgi:hypothetical protein
MFSVVHTVFYFTLVTIIRVQNHFLALHVHCVRVRGRYIFSFYLSHTKTVIDNRMCTQHKQSSTHVELQIDIESLQLLQSAGHSLFHCEVKS